MNKMIVEFTRFVIVGMINTIVTYVIFIVAQLYIQYMIAYTIAFVFGVVLSYALNALFVFSGRHSVSAAVKFPGVYVVQYLYGAAAIRILVEYLHLSSQIAIIVVIGTSTPLTFALVRLVFASPAQKTGLAGSRDHT